MCFVWISEQIAIISLCSINISVSITEAESVYCAAQTGSSNQTQFRPERVKAVSVPALSRLISDVQVLGLFTFVVSEMWLEIPNSEN